MLNVNSAVSQSVSNPQTPTFTAQVLSYSTYTPYPQTSPDTQVPSEESLYMRINIQLAINNQPLPSNLDSGKYSIYYLIHFKAHSQKSFRQIGINSPIDNSLSPDETEASITEELQSAIPADQNSTKTVYYLDTGGFNIVEDQKIDLQVKAVIVRSFNHWVEGFIVTTPGGYQDLGPVSSLAVTQYSQSNWSQTQTLTIPQSTPTPSSNSPNITLPDNAVSLVIGAIAVVSLVLVVVLFLYVRKLRKTIETQKAVR